MQDVITINNYAEFEQKFDNVMQETAEKFVVIGYMLKVARDTDILRESGYSTMGEFAQKRYGLTKDIASRYIAINDRYSEGGYSEQLDTRYRTFGYAKLAEMLTLPDVIMEEITPEMTREDIRGIKGEVAAERDISDIEVLIEEKDQGAEEQESVARKMLYQICRENPNIFKELWVAVNEKTAESEEVMNILAPSGIAMISCRIPGTGRLMLSIKGIEENPQIINIRTSEKEEVPWGELAGEVIDFLWCSGETQKAAYWKIYNEELPEEEKTEVAPAQPKTERVVKAKPEKSKKTPKKEEKKVEPVAASEEQLPGQMEVADYPELMPEGEENGIHRTADADGRPSNSGNTESNETEGGAGTESGTSGNESEVAQSNEQRGEEKSQEDSPKTVAEIFKEIRALEETAVSENEAIRRKFMVFSRGKMPIGELELVKEHAENLLASISRVISLKTNAKDGM